MIQTMQSCCTINQDKFNHSHLNFNWNISIQKFYNTVLKNPFLKQNYEQGMKKTSKYISLEQICSILNIIIITPPKFQKSGLAALPFTQLFFQFMGTINGYHFFSDKTVNQALKQILNEYGKFLQTQSSLFYLNQNSPDGWFCPEAKFYYDINQFECNQNSKNYGFHSWNQFFIRKFKPGFREIQNYNDQTIIINSCQATPYKIQFDIQKKDKFWMKHQPYSLFDIFAVEQLKIQSVASRFIGGTIYQGYLSPFNYHRWHSPISGVIQGIYRISGTYYSQNQNELDDQTGINSQSFLTAAATRMIIVIKAQCPRIKSVACVFIGMGEVSSCYNIVKIGDKIRKGDEMGYFQFGGSSHCLIFQKNVINQFLISAENKPKLVKLYQNLAIINE